MSMKSNCSAARFESEKQTNMRATEQLLYSVNLRKLHLLGILLLYQLV
jgi:hypothetical protein